MIYQALYRSFRPQTFADVVGQEHIVRTLENMLRQERIYHAFLFCGPRGTGKTSLAKILAKALNCQQSSKPTATPCLTCASCRAIKEGGSLDVLEIDGASNRGIDEIRDLRDSVKFSPSQSRYKVYIIDEVHMLTMEAFNALLKTLEEPPQHVIFIFATTEVQKLPVTILSRVQRFDFRRHSQTVIRERLQEVAAAANIAYEEAALKLMAQAANGGMRDALALLDQTYSYAGDAVLSVADVQAVAGLVPYAAYVRLWKPLVAGDMAKLLQRLRDIIGGGKETAQVTAGFIAFCRDLLFFQSDPALVQSENRAFFTDLAGSSQQAMILIEELLSVEREQRFTSEPAILLELAFFRFMQRVHQGIPLVTAASEPVPTVQAESPATPTRVATIEAEDVFAEAVFMEATEEMGEPEPPPEMEWTAPEPPPPAVAVKPTSKPPELLPTVVETPPEPLETSPAVTEPPTAATPQADKTLTIRQIGQKWPDLLAKIMSNAPALGAKLAGAQLALGQGDKIMLQFEKEFSRNFVAQSDNLSAVREEFSRILGQEVKLDCVLLTETAEPDSEAEVMAATETDGLKVALSLFEGQSVDPIR